MYNLVYGFVAVLEELDIISEEAYHAFCRRLSTKILPSNSRDALVVVQEVFKDTEKELSGKNIKVEPWLDHIASLDARLKKVEKSLLTKKK